jgi:CHASE2 domain-containing sensor protein
VAIKTKLTSIKRVINFLGEFLLKTIERICNLLNFRETDEKKRAQLCINIWTGITVVLLMYLVENTQWGEGILNRAFDGFIRKEANNAVKTIADTSQLLLVDLDHRKPENPNDSNKKIGYLSPRDTIARVIKMASHGKAKLIVLDILLDEKDCCFPEKDKELQKVLEAFPTDKNFQTKVIFAQKVGKNGNLKKNLFDHLIEVNPNFYRAIPTLYATKKDRVVRYWKAYEVYGKTNIIWSIPVLTLALNEGRIEDLKKREKQLVQKKNGMETVVVNVCKGKDDKTSDLHFRNRDLYRQRIRFSLIPKDCIDNHPAGNLILPTIENLNPQRFDDKIVLIGASDYEKGDIHPTPLGDMPGMYIHGNAIHTLLRGFQPAPPPTWIAIVFDIFIVICASYVFKSKRMESFYVKSVGTLALILASALISYLLFFRYFGIFFNFAFGTAAVGYFDTVSAIRETYLKKIKTKKKKKDKED